MSRGEQQKTGGKTKKTCCTSVHEQGLGNNYATSAAQHTPSAPWQMSLDAPGGRGHAMGASAPVLAPPTPAPASGQGRFVGGALMMPLPTLIITLPMSSDSDDDGFVLRAPAGGASHAAAGSRGVPSASGHRGDGGKAASAKPPKKSKSAPAEVSSKRKPPALEPVIPIPKTVRRGEGGEPRQHAVVL